MSAPSSSSSSADAPSAHDPAAPVTVEDESTKQCSVCLADWPKSAYSSTQLKKKDKRACHSCVAKKDGATVTQQEAAAEAAAAARKDAMKDAFAARLNSAPPQAAAQCLCCKSKAAVRSVACIRCSVPCCSLKCFDGHDCDTYLAAARTMPTVLIPQEDRFASMDEIRSSWQALVRHLLEMPASSSVPMAVACCRSALERASALEPQFRAFDWTLLCRVSSPSVSLPWWSPACCERLGIRLAAEVIGPISMLLWWVADCATNMMEQCAVIINQPSQAIAMQRFARGGTFPRDTTTLTSACLLPSRMLHKLTALLIFVTRALPPSWLQANFGSAGQVQSDQFGLLPAVRSTRPDQFAKQLVRIGYVEHAAPRSGLRTLVPLTDNPSDKFCFLRQDLGYAALSMVTERGELLLDQGLCLLSTAMGMIVLSAVSGWTGRVSDSFAVAPTEAKFMPIAAIEQLLLKTRGLERQLNAELAVRNQPGFFHIIPAIQSMMPEDEWIAAPGASLFIATPQLGVESELVELSLLESLVEDAAAGDAHAQLLIVHIESECAAPIAEVISAQKSRLEQMLEDQAAQLRIHAEAVARAELRGRIKAAAVEGSSEGASSSSIGASASVSSSSASASTLASTSAASSSSALAPVSAASAAAPSVCAGSSTALSSVPSASAAPGESAVTYSWTASKAYASLADVCTAGRAKYKTITSAALRFLHSLRPVSVNRSGGSHTVFHFASGKPVTLVQPHGGEGTVSNHATRLYAALYEAVLQFSPSDALAASSSSRAGVAKSSS